MSDEAPLLSVSQEQWLRIQELAPDSPFVKSRSFFELEGPLDVSALEKTFDEVFRRHDAIRTNFPVVEGRRVQAVAPYSPGWRLPVVDVGALPDDERRAAVLRLATEETEHVFDLEREPLFRARLVKLGEHRHVLLMSAHHLVTDGWSFGVVLVKEIKSLYAAFS